MATTQAPEVQREEMDIFSGLVKETASKQTLGNLQKKADLVARANEEYLGQFKKGTEQVLAGGQRETAGKQKIDEQIARNKEFVAYVGQTVEFLTSEFGQVDQYLGNITQNFQGEEQVLVDKAKKTLERAETPVIKWFVNKAKLAEESARLQKQAETMRTERILSSSLAQNIGQILDYYKNIKTVMYNAGIANKKSEMEIAKQRDATMVKLTENEKQYDAWQQDRIRAKAELDAIDLELVPLTGELRTAREAARLQILDKFNKAEQQEGVYFNVVKNAREDLKYQEQVLGDYRGVLKGLHNAIVDMEQKIDNRTVLFTNIEVMVKTAYQVKSFGIADKVANRTLAEIVKVSASTQEAILEELGQRAVARPMSPDELKSWVERSKAARKGYEDLMASAKADYAATGNSPTS